MKCYIHPDRDAVGMCVGCGKPICEECLVTLHDRNYCKRCTAKLAQGRSLLAENLSPRSWTVALLLSVFLGGLGIDRFYLGKVGTGILKLLTCGGLGLWWLIDIIIIATGNMTDKTGRLVKPHQLSY